MASREVPNGPEQHPPGSMVRTVNRVRAAFFQHEQPLVAAALAYSIIFAVFPLMLLVLSASSLVFTPAAGFDTLINRLFGLPGTGTLVSDSFRAVFARREDVGLVSVFGLLVTAAGPVAAAEAGVNRAWGSPRRGGWRRYPWLLGCAVGLMALLAGGTLAILWPLRSVRHLFSPELAPGAGQPLAITLVWVAMLSYSVFTLAYRFLPTKRVRWKDAARGGAAGAAVWMALVFGLTAYLTTAGDPSYRYAALGSVLAFVTWGYGLALSFLIGAEVSAADNGSMQNGRSPIPAASGGEIDVIQ